MLLLLLGKVETSKNGEIVEAKLQQNYDTGCRFR